MSTAPQAQFQEETFNQEAITVATQLRSIVVVDQETFDLASAILLQRAEWKKKVVEFFKPMKEAAHNAHKVICEREKSVLSVGEPEDDATRRSVAKFSDDQERLRRKIETERIETQRKIDEEARLNDAQRAEAMGAPKEAVQQILDTPSAAPPPSVAPTYQRVAGVGTAKVWTWRPEGSVDRDRATDAEKLRSLKLLVKAAAKDERLLAFLLLNEKQLGKIASAAASVPGIQFYQTTNVRIGGR